MRTHLNTIIDVNDPSYWINSILSACLCSPLSVSRSLFTRGIFLTILPTSLKKHTFHVSTFFSSHAFLGSCRVRCAQRPLTQTVVHFSRQSAFFIRTWLGAQKQTENARAFSKYCRWRPRQRLKLQFKLDAGTRWKSVSREIIRAWDNSVFILFFFRIAFSSMDKQIKPSRFEPIFP